MVIASTRLGLRMDPMEDLVLSAILRDWAEKFGARARTVYLTDHIARDLEADHGIRPLTFGAAIRRLVHSGILLGDPILGTPIHWHVHVPEGTWSAYERQLVTA
jgi:hypothetical protein